MIFFNIQKAFDSSIDNEIETESVWLIIVRKNK